MLMTDLFPAGERVELGTKLFSAEDIIRFARRFDPQPFHVDAEQAKESLFGGLCASGWHTSAGWMATFLAFWSAECSRLAAEGSAPPQLGPSPGFRKLAWLRPVFAGDSITYFVTPIDSRPLASRPGWRVNSMLSEGRNQNGEWVIRFESTVLEPAEAR